MKRKSVFLGLLLSFGFLAITALANNGDSKSKNSAMPENIKAIVDNKCFGCHNDESKNDDAKKDLNFSTFDELSKMSQISAYKKITEVLEEQKMPPQKFLEHFPDKNITAEERTALLEWAQNEAKALVGGN